MNPHTPWSPPAQRVTSELSDSGHVTPAAVSFDHFLVARPPGVPYRKHNVGGLGCIQLQTENVEAKIVGRTSMQCLTDCDFTSPVAGPRARHTSYLSMSQSCDTLAIQVCHSLPGPFERPCVSSRAKIDWPGAGRMEVKSPTGGNCAPELLPYGPRTSLMAVIRDVP